MDILLWEKALNGVKVLATMAGLINALVLVAIVHRFITRQSYEVK